VSAAAERECVPKLAETKREWLIEHTPYGVADPRVETDRICVGLECKSKGACRFIGVDRDVRLKPLHERLDVVVRNELPADHEHRARS
jgi:hypothetical protein